MLKRDGSVWTTGCNRYGQLGTGSLKEQTAFVQVVSGRAKAVIGGSRHSMVLKRDGSVFVTGYNVNGQLGDGSAINKEVFVEVISGGVKAIAAGGFHSMLLKQDGSIWATGSNQYGQFGDDIAAFKLKFVRVEPFDSGTVHGTIIFTGSTLATTESSNHSYPILHFVLHSACVPVCFLAYVFSSKI